MKEYPVQECLGAGKPEKRKTQVREQMNVIQATAASVRDSLEHLLHKLEPVLRQEPVCNAEDKEKIPPSNLVPLASGLKEIHRMVAGNNSIVIDILDRLEL